MPKTAAPPSAKQRKSAAAPAAPVVEVAKEEPETATVPKPAGEALSLKDVVSLLVKGSKGKGSSN